MLLFCFGDLDLVYDVKWTIRQIDFSVVDDNIKNKLVELFYKYYLISKESKYQASLFIQSAIKPFIKKLKEVVQEIMLKKQEEFRQIGSSFIKETFNRKTE